MYIYSQQFEFAASPPGRRRGVGLQEDSVSGLRDGAAPLSDQRQTQHPSQGGGAVVEQLQQGRLFHPGPGPGEDQPGGQEGKQPASGNDEDEHSPPPLSLQTIVSWTGSQANVFEKQKVCEIASLIRDTERHGKARIVDATEGEEPDEMLKVRTRF